MSNGLEIFLCAIIGGIISLKFLALYSRKKCAAYGLVNGQLAPKNHLANSVCSEGEGSNIYPLTDCDASIWSDLTESIKSLNGNIVTHEKDYLHAIFRTPIWGFEDDLEARFDTDTKSIHFRSSSRVGYSDMGTNTRRVEELKRLLA